MPASASRTAFLFHQNSLVTLNRQTPYSCPPVRFGAFPWPIHWSFLQHGVIRTNNPLRTHTRSFATLRMPTEWRSETTTEWTSGHRLILQLETPRLPPIEHAQHEQNQHHRR